MMLTTSTNDGEALIALRKANRILAEARINWEECGKQMKEDEADYESN
jgi:hypothetical protein